jgi:hypothetical protein
MVKVGVVLGVRDGEDVIGKTLMSLVEQNNIEIFISIGNDCSIDNSRNIVDSWIEESKYYPNVTMICFDFPRRDKRSYHKLPLLLNRALTYLPECDYYMVSGDDMYYPPDYILDVIDYMIKDGSDIASGYSIEYGYEARNNAPSGSGRIFTKRVWKKVTPFLPHIAWESGALYNGLMYGIKLAMYPVSKSHLHEQGYSSTITWGYAGYILKTPILFTIIRVIMSICKRNIPISHSLSILLGHVQYMIIKPDINSGKIGEYNRLIKIDRIRRYTKKAIVKILRIKIEDN